MKPLSNVIGHVPENELEGVNRLLAALWPYQTGYVEVREEVNELLHWQRILRSQQNAA